MANPKTKRSPDFKKIRKLLQNDWDDLDKAQRNHPSIIDIKAAYASGYSSATHKLNYGLELVQSRADLLKQSPENLNKPFTHTFNYGYNRSILNYILRHESERNYIQAAKIFLSFEKPSYVLPEPEMVPPQEELSEYPHAYQNADLLLNPISAPAIENNIDNSVEIHYSDSESSGQNSKDNSSSDLNFELLEPTPPAIVHFFSSTYNIDEDPNFNLFNHLSSEKSTDNDLDNDPHDDDTKKYLNFSI